MRAAHHPTAEDNPIRGRADGATPPALIDEPLAVEIADLALSPTAYFGRIVRVTGRFRRLPVLACTSVTRRPPTDWSLTDGVDTIYVGGSDERLAQLAPSELTVSIEGRWWRWRGPVGCGKDAPTQEIWYVALRQVLAPNPITAATLTPVGEVAAAPTTPLPTSDALPVATPTMPATLTPTWTPEPLESPSMTLAAPTATATATLAPTGTPTPTPGLTGEATASPTPTVLGTPISPTPTPAGTPTPSPTPGLSPTPGGPTLTPTSSPTDAPSPTASPSATPTTPPDDDVEDMGDLSTQDLVIEILATGARHRWRVEIDAATTLTVNVATPLTLNAVVEVTREDGTILATQDDASGADPEILAVEIPDAGNYYVIVSEAEEKTGPYSMILNTSETFAFVFKGTLAYADASSAMMAAESDHFWHFEGQEGDRIALLVAPGDQSDLFIELYGPDATMLFDDPVDDGGAGVPEFLIDFELPETGFYAARIGEFNYESSDYSISLEDFGSFP